MQRRHMREYPAAAAVTLVRDGKADMLMKGLLQTSDLLRAVLNKENGLRGGGTLSHVAAIHSEAMGKTWIATDGGMVMYPDLKTKAQLIESAVKVARGLGIEMPKVAVLAAVEMINPEMPATLDAAALTAMNRRGQIRDCIVDGPLAFDLAVSPGAVKHKKVESPVAGQADILLFPNIDAGNAVVKAMTNIGGCIFGGVVMGASAPIVLTSRSDSDISKLYSIAIAASV
jgi:phosphate butyryltransferase